MSLGSKPVNNFNKRVLKIMDDEGKQTYIYLTNMIAGAK